MLYFTVYSEDKLLTIDLYIIICYGWHRPAVFTIIMRMYISVYIDYVGFGGTSSPARSVVIHLLIEPVWLQPKTSTSAQSPTNYVEGHLC